MKQMKILIAIGAVLFIGGMVIGNTSATLDTYRSITCGAAFGGIPSTTDASATAMCGQIRGNQLIAAQVLLVAGSGVLAAALWVIFTTSTDWFRPRSSATASEATAIRQHAPEPTAPVSAPLKKKPVGVDQAASAPRVSAKCVHCGHVQSILASKTKYKCESCDGALIRRVKNG